MGAIYYYDSLTDGVPSGTSYLTGDDGYLHVWNYGPAALIANYTSASSPSAPASGILVPAGQWTVLPADQSGGSERIAFAPVPLTDGETAGNVSWSAMSVWVT